MQWFKDKATDRHGRGKSMTLMGTQQHLIFQCEKSAALQAQPVPPNKQSNANIELQYKIRVKL